MKRLWRPVLITCLVVAIAGALVYRTSLLRGLATQADIDAATKTTLEWGRLAPLPSTNEEFSISTTGSVFSREFRIAFTAPKDDVEKWLKDSIGTKDAARTAPSPGVRHFEIKPSGGVKNAEVEVDDTRHRVSIHVIGI